MTTSGYRRSEFMPGGSAQTERAGQSDEQEVGVKYAPAVSVIMPIRNESQYIDAAIRSLYRNDYEGDLEVIVVDGMSDDGTRERVEHLQNVHADLWLVDNPKRTVPHAMNIGLKRARGDIIIRVDGHAAVAPDFIRACVEELQRHPECGCVGGAIENVDEGPVSRAISLAMSSPFGVGDARFRTGGYRGYVDTVAFGAYRREVFDEIGPFDEVLTRNQDDELNYRLSMAGYRIWLSDRIRSSYVVRSSLTKVFRQYFQYGYWKVYVNRKHRTVTNLRQLVPVTFVSFLLAGSLSALFVPAAGYLLLAGIGTYLAAGSAFALLRSRQPLTVARMIAAFAAMHVGYGLGYLQGLFDFALLGRMPRSGNAQLSR